jgi:hypothetical protein
MSDVIRIGNCSGFYGDRLAAAREMVQGGQIDVLSGDYLAELTMAILHNQRESRGAQLGYVGTFLKQVREVAAECLDKNIKIVSNAGGLNPKGMAEEIEKILLELGVNSKVAYIDGDDIVKDIERLQSEGEAFVNTDKGKPLSESGNKVVTANTYFGGWAIKEALDQGADIVICPRVTDAAVVIGPAAWKFNWARNDYDALAGALTAGHIIECGAQCCGGNYAFFKEVPSYRDVGYPIAEIESDGSFTITKHPGTGGLVSVGTVTAQLLYEISTPEYYNPDVIAHFDAMQIEQAGDNRVRITGCRGSSPPSTHKVCINTLGPYKQSMEVLLTGLDIEEKAKVYLDAVFHNLGGKEQFDDVDIQLIRSEHENPASNEVAHAALRVTVTTDDPKKVGRLFQAKVTELGLANIPGNTSRGAAGYNGTPVLVYWPALMNSKHVVERVHFNGKVCEVLPTQRLDLENVQARFDLTQTAPAPEGNLQQIELGRLFGTRSGDKGGCANCGVWAKTDKAYSYLRDYLTINQFKAIAPDLAQFNIERYELPNLRALNFYIHDVLGDGVSSSHRIDKQAKSMGEYLRAKLIEVPIELLG